MRRGLFAFGLLMVVGGGVVVMTTVDAPQPDDHATDDFAGYQSEEGSPEDSEVAESTTGDDRQKNSDQSRETGNGPPEGDEVEQQEEAESSPGVEGDPVGSSNRSEESRQNAEKFETASGFDVKKEREDFEGELVEEGREAMRPAARQCWEKTLEVFPEATGHVEVGFVIEGHGDYGEISVTEIDEDSTLHEERLHECLTEQLFDVQFEQLDGDQTVEGAFAFVFQEREGN